MNYGQNVKRLGQRQRARAALGHSGGVGRRWRDVGSGGRAEQPSDQNYEQLLTFVNLVNFRFRCENAMSLDALAWEVWGIDANDRHVLGDAGEQGFAMNEASQNFSVVSHVC